MAKGLTQRPFSRTGRTVSLLGLGTVKFGRNEQVKYPEGEGFALPSDSAVEGLLDLCLGHGITLLDTAPAYGVAEERLGALMGNRREKFFLMTKTGEEFSGGKSEYVFTAEHTRKSVERSLRRLRTDRLDCVLVHCSRDDLRVLTDTPVVETLLRMQEEGKVLSTGASTYTVEGGKKAVDLLDAVMVAYNKSYTDERPVIDHAQAQGKAVLVKKGLASGHIACLGDVGDNVRFVLSTPGVTSLVFGSLQAQNILDNIAAAQDVQ